MLPICGKILKVHQPAMTQNYRDNHQMAHLKVPSGSRGGVGGGVLGLPAAGRVDQRAPVAGCCSAGHARIPYLLLFSADVLDLKYIEE